ncbi:MAG TPA: M6 family metalloprotease domain-containing protein, partial [archaeon]|nr:M6 family metalloprotease domain-containing protein [archaeon]
MRAREYFVISIILLLFISSSVYSEEIFAKKTSLEINDKEIKLEENIQEKYQEDVFFPPEEYLLKQGMTLESYKQSLIDNAPKNRNSSVNNIDGTSPLTGNIHIPVLLVEFTDKPHTLSLTDINAAFNSPNYLNGQGISVSKYYAKQSYGALNVTFDVFGWQTAPHTYSYYSQNNNTNFQMELDTINLFNSTIDYSQYDNDGSGRIDGFVIIYAGKAGVAPNAVWPHARIVRNYTGNPVDGKYLGNIAVVPELGHFGNQFEIPVTTHEFAHVLGLMDLYSIGPNGSGSGPIKNFTMMIFDDDYCLNKPINLDVWSRYFLGWIDPIVLTTDSQKEISLRSVNDYPDAVILKNNNMTAREFFIIENRHRNASDPNNLDNCMFSNSSSTRGGFAIYHVDENKIEAHYPNNWVNWDPDGNYFDDTISHPGIMYEKNYISNYNGGGHGTVDMYFNATVEGCDS